MGIETRLLFAFRVPRIKGDYGAGPVCIMVRSEADFRAEAAAAIGRFFFINQPPVTLAG